MRAISGFCCFSSEYESMMRVLARASVLDLNVCSSAVEETTFSARLLALVCGGHASRGSYIQTRAQAHATPAYVSCMYDATWPRLHGPRDARPRLDSGAVRCVDFSCRVL